MSDLSVVAELRAEISDFVGKMGTAKTAFDDTTKGMEDDAGKRSTGIVDKLGGIGPAITKTVLPAAVAVGGVATVLADQWSGANTAMQAATGATGAALDNLMGSVQNVTGSVKGNMGQVADVMALVAAKTDLTGPPLEDLTRKFLQLKESGIDVSIGQVGMAFGRWGIPVDQWGTSMERVLKVSQATGRGMGDVLDQIAKGAPVLQGLGFSFNDASLLAGKLSDDALPGLKRALAGAIADGKTGKQAFDELVASIKAAPDPTTATALAMDVFGKRAGPELALQIRSGKFELGAMTAEMDKNTSSIAKGAEAHRTFADKLGMFKDKLGAMVAPYAENAQVVSTLVGGVASGIPIWEKVHGMFGKLKTAKEGLAVASGVAATAESVESGANVVAGGTAAAASGGFFALAAGVWAAIAPLLPIIAAMALVGIAAYELYQHWDEVWGFIKGIAKDAYEFVKRNIDLFVIAIGLPLAPLFLLWKHWDQVWGAVSGAIGGAWDIVKGVFEEIKQGIEEVIGAVDKVTSKLGSLPGGGIIKGAASLFGYAEGGTVPGPVGAPQLAIVHGGEVVVPPNQVTSMGTPARAPAVGGGSGGNVVHINVTVHGSVWTTRDLATELAPLVDDAQRQRFQSGRGSAA